MIFFTSIVTYVTAMMTLIFFILIVLICLVSSFKNGMLFLPWWEICKLSLKLGGVVGVVIGVGTWYLYSSKMRR